jgi:hypothetical protein
VREERAQVVGRGTSRLLHAALSAYFEASERARHSCPTHGENIQIVTCKGCCDAHGIPVTPMMTEAELEALDELKFERESDDRADFAEEWAREDKLDREREWDESYVDEERAW